jgi:hypothetical protein
MRSALAALNELVVPEGWSLPVTFVSALVALRVLFACGELQAQTLMTDLPYPEAGADTWVLIEIWPEVNDITLSAYFMDFLSRKNENLCKSTKSALDRDADARAKEQNRKFTSYRQCLMLSDAIYKGYVKRQGEF